MKNNKGVTLTTIVITISVMLILTSTIIFNATNRLKSEKLDNMYSDLNILKDKVNTYYLKYGKLPLEEEYTAISQIPTNVLNPNDEGSKYYVIDLNAMENLSLSNANNIYIINEGTHTIYYVAGVEFEGVTYYRLPEEYSTLLPLYWDFAKIANVVTETVTIDGEQKTRNAPIPKGYVASSIDGEDAISDGLVIYQGIAPVTGVKNSTGHLEVMETRNQFVWIPVDDINQMVMCKSNTSTSICNLVLQKTTEGYKLKCATHDSTDLCGRLYATKSTTTNSEKPYIVATSMNFADRSQTWTDTDYREPDIVSSYDNDTRTGDVDLFEENLINDFYQMALSVAKYRGFYVSRYELGVEVEENGEEINVTEKGVSRKNKRILAAGETTAASGTTYTGYNVDTFVDGGGWYGLYNTIKDLTDETAGSHMVWGCQYDQIIKFLEENSSNEPQIGHVGRQLATQELTGSTTDIMSNIYDLEGNNREWTAQANDTLYRVSRGGVFYYLPNHNDLSPAAYRTRAAVIVEGCGYCTRSVIYIKN